MQEPASQVFPIAPLERGGSVEQMGVKAFNLLRMARLGLPVPEGFALGTAFSRLHLTDPQGAAAAMRPSLDQALQRLERDTKLRLGDARRPLLVSVRSGAAVSMPGMMDTLLDIGLTQRTLRGLLRLTGNPRLVWDSYRRLIQSFAETVHGADPAAFLEVTQRSLARGGHAEVRELDFLQLASLCEELLELHEELTGHRFPQDAHAQLDAAVDAVLESWQSERARAYRSLHMLPGDAGTAVTVQRMVFGNAGGTSGAGVAFTRDPSSGEKRLYVDFLFGAQGEDVVSGRHCAGDAERLPSDLPEAFRQLVRAQAALEREFRDAQEIEFTIEEGRLYLLQTRTAKRTPWAALRVAVEQVREGLIDPATALARLEGIELDALAQTRVSDTGSARAIGRATAAALGVTSGRIALDADAVRAFAARGERAILVRNDTSTEDIAAIAAAAGLLTAAGSRTAHAAVVARQLGKVSLVGCASLVVDANSRSIRINGHSLREGDLISLDANEGVIYAGEAQVHTERPLEWLAEVALWRAKSGPA